MHDAGLVRGLERLGDLPRDRHRFVERERPARDPQAQIFAIDELHDQRALIFEPTRPDYWQVRIQPTDTIQMQAVDVNVDAAIANALANRTDLIVAKRQLEIADLGISLLQNQSLPSVDLQLNYSASGTGGTQNSYSNDFPPVLLSSSQRGFGAVFGDAFRNTNPAWTIGVNVGYPLGKSSTEAALATRRLEKQRAEINLRDSELQVTTGVRDAGRQVSTNFKRVQVTQVARQRAERQLEAEQKRFSVGLSTTFQLQSRQRDLARARINELQAIIDYSRSLITFERTYGPERGGFRLSASDPVIDHPAAAHREPA